MANALKDKIVVVTGGDGGLGTAVVDQLIEEGAKIFVPLFGEAPDAWKNAYYDSVYWKSGIDLTNEDEAGNFYQWVTDEAGVPWASLQIAGGFDMASLENTGIDRFRKQWRINTETCFNACRAAVEQMRKEEQGGRLVNVASRPALEPRQGANLSAYTASKAAVAALTQALAAELVEEDILVNAVAPSIIDTQANRKAMPDADHAKWVKPEAIAREMIWLAHPENTVTRGAVVPVYGKS